MWRQKWQGTDSGQAGFRDRIHLQNYFPELDPSLPPNIQDAVIRMRCGSGPPECQKGSVLAPLTSSDCVWMIFIM